MIYYYLAKEGDRDLEMASVKTQFDDHGQNNETAASATSEYNIFNVLSVTIFSIFYF